MVLVVVAGVVVAVVVGVVVVAAADIETGTSTVCVNAPLVPVTFRVKPPVVAVAAAVTVSVAVPVPSAGGVKGVGRLTVTSEGAVPNHDHESATALLKPFRD